jgi:hypothetical protein
MLNAEQRQWEQRQLAQQEQLRHGVQHVERVQVVEVSLAVVVVVPPCQLLLSRCLLDCQ